MDSAGRSEREEPGLYTSGTVRFVVAAALVTAVLFITQTYVWVNLWPVSMTWSEAILAGLPQLLLWGLSVPLILAIADRLPVTREKAANRLLLHLVLSFGLAVAVLAVLDLSDRWLHWTTLLGVPGTLVSGTSLVTAFDKTLLHLHMGVAIYWMVLAGRQTTGLYAQVQENRVRASEAEAKLAETRLETLRGQLQPHFLFNTLNSVAVLMRRDPHAAEVMLHRVSDLLRAALGTEGGRTLTLRDELELVATYLEIERTRFQDRLRVEFDVSAEAREALVPSLILQPLVENAVKHGIAPHSEGGTVRVGARRSNGDLFLEVVDDGVGFHRERSPGGTGIGLSNTVQRLQALYGAGQRLDISRPEGGGTAVRIVMPYRTEDR